MKKSTLSTIINSFNENKNSHAFLMETNNLEKCLEDVKALIFNINGIENLDLSEENFPDIRIIRKNGKEIKREQIGVILDEFQTFPVFLKHRYYIIVESETMNQTSANTILKFLEEPEGDIIGFFITMNKSAMINTIVSRCQHYKMLYDTNLSFYTIMIEKFIDNMNCKEVYKKILFLNSFIGKDRGDNIESLKSIKEYLLKNKMTISKRDLKLLVKRARLLDNVIERLLRNANQELVILDLAKNWK